MKTIYTLIISLMCMACAARAEDTQVMSWFKQANAAYQQQQYDSAIAYYEQIIGSGMKNADVFFNLGNAYFRKKQIGMAILYYERARKLEPTDADILANIAFSNRHITDRIPEPERGLLETALLRLHKLFPLRVQLWTIWAFVVVVCTFFSVGLFVSRNVRLWFIYLGCLCGICMSLLGISAGIKIHKAENTTEAIVLEKRIDARNEPDGATILFSAHEGTKFRLHQQSNGWQLVSLPNGVKGWVEQSALGEI